MAGKVLWVLHVTLRENITKSGSDIFRYKEEVDIGGGHTIGMMEGWFKYLHLDQRVFHTELF